MTVSGTGAEFGIAPQASKIGSGTFTPGSYSFRRFRTLDLGVGPAQMMAQFPPETGIMTPTGAYKRGAFYGGTVAIMPRSLNVLGFFLYALMGNASPTTGKDIDGVTSTNTNTHIFSFNANHTVPWFSVVRKIPGQVSANDLAEYGYDCQMNSMRLRMPAANKVSAEFEMAGRVPTFLKNPGTLSWANTLENGDSVPETFRGYWHAGANQPKVLDLTLDFTNNISISEPMSEMVVGSPYPDDSIVLGPRTAILTAVMKWEDPDLYLQMLTNSANGTAWSSTPFTTTVSGNQWGFKTYFESPLLIPSSSPARQYALAIRASTTTWMIERVNPAPGQPVVARVRGTIQEPGSGTYLDIMLQNDVASYAWS